MSLTGAISKGQQVEIMGFGRSLNNVTVSDVQVFKKSIGKACAGENVGVLLKGIRPEMIER